MSLKPLTLERGGKFFVAQSIAVSAVLAVLLMLVAGCGGEGGGSSTEVTTSSLSKAAFVKKADAACTRGYRRIEGDAGDGESTGESEAEIIAAGLVPAYRGVVKEIQALGAPSGEEKKVEAFLGALQTGLDEIESRDSFKSVADLEKPLDPAGDLAREMSIETCGFGSG